VEEWALQARKEAKSGESKIKKSRLEVLEV